MDYEGFKKQVYAITTIDLNAYKERQMKRRIDALIAKNRCQSYDEYVNLIQGYFGIFILKGLVISKSDTSN